ncbi:SpoIIE family protein phosphatase [Nocardia sp. NPDC004068]|uniref:SpoIIE family protein phosphatase n=1 Tax=Nocardia sp. NPDC004068 TaxID=3364303 RepID=UPI00368913F3
MAGSRGVFAADDEVGRDLAAVDWAATPLADPRGWPQSLRTAVNILLSSRFSMWMAWGPELTFFCNAAYRRDTLGRKYPWALGRPARQVWAEIWHDIGPRIESVLATGEATWDEALLLFLERSEYREETYHTFSYSPLRDDAGAVVGMLCVVSEETERVIGARRMATLRDLGSDPSVIRTEGEMLDFVAAQLARNPRDLPFTLLYLFDGDGRARLRASSGIGTGHPAAPAELTADPTDPWPLAAGPEPIPLDDPRFGELPTGEWAEPPTHALVVPLRRQGDSPLGLLVAGLNRYRPIDAAYRDFVQLVAGHLAAGIAGARGYAEQRRRAEELAELDRAKTIFFANISHEFRTPLTLIMDPVRELRERLGEADPAVRADLELVHRNGLRLGKLVNSLLDFSRIEAGRMRARHEPVELAGLTAELASVFRSAVEKAGLRLEVDCPPLPRPVYVDRGMWEKVILNLLSNALKFTFEGTIRVAVREDGGEAVVTVADTGVGVPAAEMPRLFERFHRVENARARSHEGSGIGLALVRELVVLHGGSIDAESTEGVGTSFTVRLPFGRAHLADDAIAAPGEAPVADDSAEPYVQEAWRWLPDADPHAEVVAAVSNSPDARVLVADDNADMRDYLTRLLRGAGYRAEAVADGREALNAVRAGVPDLVVADVMMPGLDGLALVNALRADPRTASVPVVLLSARAGQEASAEGLRAGADDYLVKPFAAADLLARVRATIELARLRGHHSRWRAALIDSLQEAFFVCDATGAVIEINAAFTDTLGYGPEGLPYRPIHPWWPRAESDPQAVALIERVFAGARRESRGTHTVPAVHRDGRRLWLRLACNEVRDPDTGRRALVGTLRDVTAERYAAQRETALAALSTRIADATNPSAVVAVAIDELKRLWHADEVIAALFTDDEAPTITSTEDQRPRRSPTVRAEASARPGTTGGEVSPRREPLSEREIGAEGESSSDSPTGGEALSGRESLVEPEGVSGSEVLSEWGSGERWEVLDEAVRGVLERVAGEAPLRVVGEGSWVGVGVGHPEGRLAVVVELGRRGAFGREDEQLLGLLAGHVAQALTRAHAIDQQRATAIALQRAILGPARLPEGFAVRYEPATRPLEVGGDWYDVVPLPDERIGIVVGDCVGHGLAAAAVMGQLRSACRALLLEQTSPAQTLAALDQFAAGVPGARFTTVFCGILTPETGELSYASAGHPPGILTRRDGTVALLDAGRSLPLAVRPGNVRPQADCRIPPRATLMLYTDGLVERRRRSLTVGIEQAGDALREGRGLIVDELATRIMARMAPREGFVDDVALLLYRHPAPLDIVFPAIAAQIPPVRHALRDWLRRSDIPRALAQNILVAAGEACANAIEHGHRDAPGQDIRLRAEVSMNRLELTVSDTGRWKTPDPVRNTHRGRGTHLMRALMEHVDITSTPTGTTVAMKTRIS